jgi:hypothetical protein
MDICASEKSEDIVAAERRGAERMREQAARTAENANGVHFTSPNTQIAADAIVRKIAKAIRNLPVE